MLGLTGMVVRPLAPAASRAAATSVPMGRRLQHGGGGASGVSRRDRAITTARLATAPRTPVSAVDGQSELRPPTGTMLRACGSTRPVRARRGARALRRDARGITPCPRRLSAVGRTISANPLGENFL